MMRVAFLTRSLNHGGAERQLVELARGLAKRGHRVTVAVFYDGGPLEKELREAEINVRSLGKRGRWDTVNFLWRLMHFLRREKPDVLHSYLCVPNILAAMLSLLIPHARIAWGVRAANVELDKYDWLARMTYRVECLLARAADLIIVNSYAGLDYAAAHGFPKNKMIVIHNGIDTDRYRPDQEARQRLRSEWRVGTHEKLIGIVGRLDPMKDHVNFLKAASLLANTHNDVRFVCVGTGAQDYQRRLIELSRDLNLSNTLIWAGARADMPAVYNAMDILVSASSGEGFSNVIGEAMACSVSCVVTDVGDSALVVGDHGEVAPAKNPEALKLAIERALDKLNRNGDEQTRNRRQIIERFSINALVANTEASLLRLNQQVEQS